MGFYRKKPVVIEAYQFNGFDLPHGTSRAPGENQPAYIDTLEGRMTVSEGDWVIKGVKGEFYPCKHDIFVATYEPAEADGDMVSMKFHRKDWETICEALGHAQSNLYTASERYARNAEDKKGYEELAETAYKIQENIQYQLGNRSFSSNKG